MSNKIRDAFRRLREAGRVLSKKNEERLRRLVSEATAILDELDGTVSEAERSLNQTMQALHDAVRTQYSGPGLYAYVEDVFEANLVFRLNSYNGEGPNESALYQVDYSIDANDRVTLGDPVEVLKRVVYEPMESDPEPMQESGLLHGEIIPLIERGLRSDGTGRIKIIQPGWGSSGYYPAAVLERDGPTVFKKGTHMYIDHPTPTEQREKPERSVERLAGVTTSDAVWEAAGTDGPGLYADIEVRPSHREDLDALADHIGVSIVAQGSYRVDEVDGRKGRVITALTQGDSIDFVTRAGAGGAILPLLEARRTGIPAPPAPQHKEDAMSKEELAELAELRKLIESQQTEIARMRERDMLREAQGHVQRQLAGSNLPQPTQQRLARHLASTCPVTEAGALDVAALTEAVKGAIADELAYLGEVAPTGRVRGVGAPTGTPASGSETPTTTSLEEAFAAWGMTPEQAKLAAR